MTTNKDNTRAGGMLPISAIINSIVEDLKAKRNDSISDSEPDKISTDHTGEIIREIP